MTPSETTTEEKSSRSYWGFVLWPFVILLLYVLGSGPAMFAYRRGIMANALFVAYRPLLSAVYPTRLQKPFGMYLHLWVPELYDKDGIIIVHPPPF
jgi:hypothetical protein